MSGEHVFYIALAGIVGGCAIVAIPIVGQFWRSIVRDTKLIELKLELVRQGYSVEHIERVVAAGSEPLQAPETPMTPEQLKVHLAGEGYTAEDIERIVLAGHKPVAA